MELLEFLGSWEGSDEDLDLLADMVEMVQVEATKTRSDAKAKEERLVETDVETDDES